MRTRRPKDHSPDGKGRTAFAVAGLAAVLSLCEAASSAAGIEQPHHVADETHLLSPQERTQLEAQLQSARSRLASPVYVHLVRQLHRETAAQMAERLLGAVTRESDVANTNPVLILVAVSDNDAAVVTGKGNAGIVPEMDAAEIVRQLKLRPPREQLSSALRGAIEAVVESALATTARRRPLPAADDDLAPEDRQAGDDAVSSDASDDASAVQAPTPPRSRVPIAAGIAGLIIIALGLRRRRGLNASRGEIPVPPPGKPRLPAVIDTPPPPHRRPPTRER